MARLPADISHKPSRSDLTRSAGEGGLRFYTAAGWLTPYALSCGYVQRRGTEESGAVLQALPSAGCGYIVHGTGRWIRGEATRTFRRLGDARAYFSRLDHAALSAKIHDAHLGALA